MSGPSLPPQAPLAIVAGAGDLPRLLAQDCMRENRPFVVVLFAGFSPEWARDMPRLEAEFEKPARMFKALSKDGFAHVTFAGSMQRPQLSPLKFDWKFLKLAPTLLPAMKSGDDVTLRVITQIFEGEGMQVIGAHDVLSGLLADAGVLTEAKLTKADWADIRRGFEIAATLGSLDVGQGAVVAQGVCLAVESIQGTDVMLDFVARTASDLRPDRAGAKGVLCKSPKPGQDWRMDLPAIGPQTVENAAKAGLAGIAVQSGGVLILGAEDTRAKADELGLFIVGVPRENNTQ